MSYDSAFEQIGDIEESDKSVNPISTPYVSSHTLMADDERSNNGDNELIGYPLSEAALEIRMIRTS